MDLHVWLLMVIMMRVIKAVNGGLKVGCCSNGVICIKCVMRVNF